MPKPVEPPPLLCPECRNGKCPNCTVRVLDDEDQWAACPCACGGGLGAWLS